MNINGKQYTDEQLDEILRRADNHIEYWKQSQKKYYDVTSIKEYEALSFVLKGFKQLLDEKKNPLVMVCGSIPAGLNLQPGGVTFVPQNELAENITLPEEYHGLDLQELNMTVVDDHVVIAHPQARPYLLCDGKNWKLIVPEG